MHTSRYVFLGLFQFCVHVALRLKMNLLLLGLLAFLLHDVDHSLEDSLLVQEMFIFSNVTYKSSSPKTNL